MPLIRDPVHTLEMQYHCMKLNQATTNAVNPGQTPVDVSDQPVYALTKEIQWMYPQQFWNYFPLMGALHMEQTFLACHGQWIEGSGLHEILSASKFTLIGTGAIIDANHIKRARYCVQVAVCALYGKLKDAVKKNGSSLSPLDWLKSKVHESDMCRYWNYVLHMQITILVFVRSIREGNFPVYASSIMALMKWIFAFDHVHYSRWMSVHLFDLLTLKRLHPDVYEAMMDGNFSFQKTNTHFNRIAIDQVHEQNNEVIKGAGGATDLLNRTDDSALIRWETCGPKVVKIVSVFEDIVDNGCKEKQNQTKKHHEDTASFRANFIKDVQNLYNKITCNPFELKSLTKINDTSFVYSDVTVNEVRTIENIGQQQFDIFWKECLVTGQLSINKKITQNKFSLLNTDLKTKCKPAISSQMLNKLRTAIAYRPEPALKLFEGELCGYPACLAEDEKSLYHGTKSDMQKRLETCSAPIIATESSIIVLEFSPLIHRLAEKPAKTFHDFAVMVYFSIMYISREYQRVDVVCDRYFTHSLKEQTRLQRGIGTRHEFTDDTPMPNNFRDFLHNSDNTNSLNEYLAKQMITFHPAHEK